MPLVRILIDGYSLLHSCPEIAPGQPPFSAAAREELVELLTRYRDAASTPITVVFDGLYAPAGLAAAPSQPEMEVLFSSSGQTADQMIERAAQRLAEFGEVLVVTDDLAERDLVLSFGASVSTCENFLRAVQNTLEDLERDIARINRRERSQFKRPSRS